MDARCLFAMVTVMSVVAMVTMMAMVAMVTAASLYHCYGN